MGSLYSVGFSNTEGLASALGKLAAGDIDAITSGGYGNLLVMAANNAGLAVSDILNNGLNDAETNDLLNSMVNYLADIYAETKNSKVVAQQYATIYGLTASDLKAAASLATSTKTISKQNLSYDGMMQQLTAMASSLYQRTSIGEMMTNLFENLQYGIAGNMGNDPILYSTFNIARLLKDLTGGIDFSIPIYLGTGTTQTFNVADIMKVAAVGGGLLGSIADLVQGFFKGSAGGFSGSGMLKAFGISNNLNYVTRGTGEGLITTETMGTSSSGTIVSNSDSSDIQNKSMTDAKDSSNQQLEITKEESNDVSLSVVDEHILAIYDLLKSITSGSAINVNVQDQFI